MTEEKIKHEVNEECCDEHSHHYHSRKHHFKHGSSALYFMGFIGAAIYYLSMSPTFWVGVLGFLKSIVWPVFLVLGALKTMGL